MKQSKFNIFWKVGGETIIYAFSLGQAVILASAERIKNGLDYSIDKVDLWSETRKSWVYCCTEPELKVFVD